MPAASRARSGSSFRATSSFAGTPLGGVGSDRLGRRPVMLASLAGSGAAALVFGFASDVWLVGAMIVAWGVVSSLFDPAASAYVAGVAPPEVRTEAFGLKRLVNNASFALGVPIGALLVWARSLRVPFVAAGVLSLAYLAVMWRSVPSTRIRVVSRGRDLHVLLFARGSTTVRVSAPGRNRTCDLALRRRTLYPLSYRRESPSLPAAAPGPRCATRSPAVTRRSSKKSLCGRSSRPRTSGGRTLAPRAGLPRWWSR